MKHAIIAKMKKSYSIENKENRIWFDITNQLLVINDFYVIVRKIVDLPIL